MESKEIIKNPAGAPAGHLHISGYITIKLDGVVHLAHRLAWFHANGSWPNGQIDHINGVKNDNRLSNIRVVSDLGNRQNVRVPLSSNKLGILGVFAARSGKRWVSRIRINGKATHLGTFDSPDMAHDAYVKAKRIHHNTCTL